MFSVYNANPYVFSDVEAWLKAKFGNLPEYENTVVVLGYNIIKMPFNVFKQSYPTSRIIVYNLEQMFEGSPWVNQHTMNWLLAANDVWDYDRENIQFLRSRSIVAKYVPFDYQEQLATYPTMEKDIDVLFYGMLSARRMRLLSNWCNTTAYTYKTMIVTGVTGSELATLIARSKILLNIHAWDKSSRQEQVRLFRPIINNTCVVSERSKYNQFGQAIVEINNMGNMNMVLSKVLSSGDWQTIGVSAAQKWKALCSK